VVGFCLNPVNQKGYKYQPTMYGMEIEFKPVEIGALIRVFDQMQCRVEDGAVFNRILLKLKRAEREIRQ